MNHDAIYALYPNVVMVDDTAGAFDKDGNKVEVDLNLVNSWVDPLLYKQLRASAYPRLADQLDMLWHAIDSGKLDQTSEFYLALKAVKETHPKPQ